tara:strand:- start:300 stop:1649 length:1350 start_codon:yes stop_codon:yes gene_type:complete
MAINFLNSINLNKNELLQGVIENQPNDASAGASPVEGQLYFNTTDKNLKQYNGTAWVSIAGDITALSPGIYIDIDNAGGPIPTIKHELTSRTDTTSSGSPGYAGTFTAVDSVTTNTTGHITALNLKTVTMPAAESYSWTLDGDTGTPRAILNGDTATIIGGTNISTVVNTPTGDNLTINLNDSITLAGDLTVSGGDIVLGGTGRIQGIDTVSAGTDAASKAYVDQAVTGLLEFKGGFNANTGALDSPLSGNLTTGGSRVAIAVGDYYVVSTAGNFFGNAATPLTPGDSVIVQTAALAGASVEGDFIIVQSDTDLATLTTVGIGNVNAGGAIDVAYSNGTATVSVEDSSASNKGAVIVAAGTGISVAYASGTATVTNTQNNSDNTATGTITAGNLTGTVTHSFGINTMVQTMSSSGDTVYCDISRTATTSVATITAAQATDITILVQKIG